jgi:hypothetical protein
MTAKRSIEVLFNRVLKKYPSQWAFNNQTICEQVVGSTDFCAAYMSPEMIAVRDQAIAEFIGSGGFVPDAMRDGQIEFAPWVATHN